jgi:hypothetical protein
MVVGDVVGSILAILVTRNMYSTHVVRYANRDSNNPANLAFGDFIIQTTISSQRHCPTIGILRPRRMWPIRTQSTELILEVGTRPTNLERHENALPPHSHFHYLRIVLKDDRTIRYSTYD